MEESLLTKEYLYNLTIEQFRRDFDEGLEMTFTTDFSFDSLKEDEDLEYLYYYADVFRQGSCQLFALALHRRFNYKTYKMEKDGIHYFCKVFVGKDSLYIDVRGVCDDVEMFTSDLTMSSTTIDSSTEYDIEQEVPIREIDKLGLAFAEWIIQKWESRYKI